MKEHYSKVKDNIFTKKGNMKVRRVDGVIESSSISTFFSSLNTYSSVRFQFGLCLISNVTNIQTCPSYAFIVTCYRVEFHHSYGEG